MNRTPEHLAEDPSLRPEFINQLSWDEWLMKHHPAFLLPDARAVVEQDMREQDVNATFDEVLEVLKDEWLATLHPGTRISEILYLAGVHSLAERRHDSDQLQATIRDRGVELGIIDERPEDEAFRQEFGD